MTSPRRPLGPGLVQGRRRPRSAEGRAVAPAASPVSGASVHAPMVEHPRCGGAVGSDRLRLRPGPAAVHPGRRTPARVGPRVGRHRAGAVADSVSTRPVVPVPGPECSRERRCT